MPTPEEIDARAARLRGAMEQPKKRVRGAHYQMIVRMAVELAAAVIVGLFLGYWLDEWLGSSPILLITCLSLSMVAGFRTLKSVNDAFVKRMDEQDDASADEEKD